MHLNHETWMFSFQVSQVKLNHVEVESVDYTRELHDFRPEKTWCSPPATMAMENHHRLGYFPMKPSAYKRFPTSATL